MANTVSSRIRLEPFCAEPYADAPEAIRHIDALTYADPANAKSVLLSAWTAITILTRANGIPDPRWLTAMAHFRKLSASALARVCDAIDMRLRAVDLAA